MTLYYKLSKPIEPQKILKDIQGMLQGKMRNKDPNDMVLIIDTREITHSVDSEKGRLKDDRKNEMPEST